MESPEIDAYRLVVTRRNVSEVLLLKGDSGWAVPQVEVSPRQRLAEQLTRELREAFGVEACCLLIPSVPGRGPAEDPKWAVMECKSQSLGNGRPAGFWVDPQAIGDWIEASQAHLICDVLAQLHRQATTGPFARPGWLEELFRWTQKQVSPLGLRLTGVFRQLNASPQFSLVRMETDRRAVWFKATGQPNVHELSVTLALAGLFPHSVPQIFGVHREWNGWLSAEVAGTSLNQIPDFAAWETAAEELAELQISSIGKTRELHDAGARDLRIARLVERIDPFLAHMDLLMAAQEKRQPLPLSGSELEILAEGLKESCALLETLHLPDTLGHIDLNPGNIFVSQTGCTFIDWAEACVTHPLLTFEYLRAHSDRSGIEQPASSERLVAVYMRPWTSFHSPDEMRRGLTLSPLIAIFAYSVANDSWRSPGLVHNQRLAGYFRGLTRRMYRVAIRTAQRSELCLS